MGIEVLKLANIRNGLIYPHDDVCYFQSCHAHHKKDGYFRIDAMPYNIVIHLLKGGKIEIIDATSNNKELSDALKKGVPTWCLVFNRALGDRTTKVCNWQNKDMEILAHSKEYHYKLVLTIRQLVNIYGHCGSLKIGNQVKLTCYNTIHFDDDPEMIKSIIKERGV